MTSPINYPLDDKDLDDAALWAVIDSAAAASLSSTSSKLRKPLALRNTNLQSPITFPISNHSPQPKLLKNPRNHMSDGEVLQEPWDHQRPQKMARSCVSELSETSPPLAIVKHVQRTPTTPSYCLPEAGTFSVKENNSPVVSESSPLSYRQVEARESIVTHSLSGRFPTVLLFKEYQNAAMEILEKNDYTMLSGSPYIKKSGWRKISFYFNISYEIKDKTIEFDENRNVQRAEFVVRAHMQGGRFSDGWGSCERREKRFSKPNHDIPSTAETRAKNRACQDLVGIGEYRSGVHAHR